MKPKSTTAWAIITPKGRIILESLGLSKQSSSKYLTYRGLWKKPLKGYTCIPVTITPRKEEE